MMKESSPESWSKSSSHNYFVVPSLSFFPCFVCLVSLRGCFVPPSGRNIQDRFWSIFIDFPPSLWQNWSVFTGIKSKFVSFSQI